MDCSNKQCIWRQWNLNFKRQQLMFCYTLPMARSGKDILPTPAATKSSKGKKKLPGVPSPAPEAAPPSASCGSPWGPLSPKWSWCCSSALSKKSAVSWVSVCNFPNRCHQIPWNWWRGFFWQRMICQNPQGRMNYWDLFLRVQVYQNHLEYMRKKMLKAFF